MASVFRRGRDQGKRDAVWYYSFVDADGRRRTRKGYRDKKLTAQAAAKAEQEAKLRRDGLVSRFDDHDWAPILEHVDAFEKDLRSGDVTKDHADLVCGRLLTFVAESGAASI
ncbi:MAG: hypothetical protein ACRC1K_16910 [Planctomycetia bacterium]